MLLTGIFILFCLQYQFTIMKLQDLEESSFLSKSAQVISIKDSRHIKQKIQIHIKWVNDKGTHRLTFLSDQGGDTHTASHISHIIRNIYR